MVFLIYHYCLNNLEMLDLTVCSFLFCRFNVPEDWPYQEVRTLFKEPNVCTEIPDFMWTSPDSQVFIDRPHYTAPIVSQAKSAFLSVFRALWISCQLKTVSVLIGQQRHVLLFFISLLNSCLIFLTPNDRFHGIHQVVEKITVARDKYSPGR